MAKAELIATMQASLLHEALSRASKIAPSKGDAMDRAGGIRITFDVMDAHVQATDLDLTFYQKVQCETVNPTTIRIATVVAQFVATLPMDRDQVVRFLRDGKSIIVQYGKTGTKVKVPRSWVSIFASRGTTPTR